MIYIWSLAIISVSWVIGLSLGTQAGIAGALIMTLAVFGVFGIYLILLRSQD